MKILHRFMCNHCFNTQDNLVYNDSPNPVCEICELNTVKLIGTPAFVFTGTHGGRGTSLGRMMSIPK